MRASRARSPSCAAARSGISPRWRRTARPGAAIQGPRTAGATSPAAGSATSSATRRGADPERSSDLSSDMPGRLARAGRGAMAERFPRPPGRIEALAHDLPRRFRALWAQPRQKKRRQFRAPRAFGYEGVGGTASKKRRPPKPPEVLLTSPLCIASVVVSSSASGPGGTDQPDRRPRARRRRHLQHSPSDAPADHRAAERQSS